jgi:hypothetical protein
MKIKINNPTIVFVVLYGVKTSTLTLCEEHEMWEFEIWLLIKIFEYKKGSKRNVELIMISSMICKFEQILHLLGR